MRSSPRLLLLTLATAATAALGLNAGLVQADAQSVTAALDQQQAEGVPAPDTAPLRTTLAGRTGLVGTLTTPALAGNPFSDLQRRSALARQAATERSRQRALDALSRLAGRRGGPGTGYDDLRAAVAAASTPAELDLLAERWTLAAQVADLERQTLGEGAGGLTGEGRPQDLADLVPQLEAAAASAASAQVEGDAATAARDALVASWALPVEDQLAAHDDLRAQALSAVDMVTKRADAKRHALDLARGIDDLLAQAAPLGVPDDVRDQAVRGRDAAPQARSDDQVHAAVGDLEQATAALTALIARPTDAPLPPCLGAQRAGGQLIWIHLASQQLIAYQDGCPWLATQVTSGRPALPTDRGTFQVFYKARAYKMISPWPKGSPFWYPDAWVYDAMEFVGDGTFIHNADWQPDSTYGPGSQYGPYASHGCVHVPDAALARLFGWTQIGATVVVGD